MEKVPNKCAQIKSFWPKFLVFGKMYTREGKVDEWAEIPDFPGYSVSLDGRVKRDRTGLVLSPTVTRRGVFVGLFKEGDQHNRMISRLVAEAFLEPPALPYHIRTFDTPINRDGDRTNNHAENLMWRPRWFAVKYHQQFHREWDGSRIRNPVTLEEFANVLTAATTFGLLAMEVFLESMNHNFYRGDDYGVWPTGTHFETLPNNSRRNRRV